MGGRLAVIETSEENVSTVWAVPKLLNVLSQNVWFCIRLIQGSEAEAEYMFKTDLYILAKSRSLVFLLFANFQNLAWSNLEQGITTPWRHIAYFLLP